MADQPAVKRHPAETHLEPGEIVKRKLTPGQAADLWLDAEARERAAKADKDEARAVLLPFLERTKKPKFKGVRRAATGGGFVLDGDKIRAFFGAKIREYEKPRASGWTIERAK